MRLHARTHRSGTGRGRASIVLVDVFDESGQLLCGAAHGADRLVVVHPHRAEETDGTESTVRQSVGGTDEGSLLQGRMVELAADAHPRAQRIDRLAEHLEQRSPALE